jgi:hypothetical protein
MKLIQTCIALMIGGALAGVPNAFASQQPQPPGEHTRAKTPEPVTGELISLDTSTKTLVLKTDAETQMKFSYSETTEIVGADKGSEGLATKAGSIVTVTYSVHGTANVAIKIEVKPKQ